MNLGFGVRQKLILLKQLDAKNELHLIAEAGVKRAILELRKDDSTSEEFSRLNKTWSNNPFAFKEIPVGEGTFTVGYDYYLRDVGGFEEGVISEEAEKIPPVRYGLIDEERKININTAEEEVFMRLFQNVVSLDKESAAELAYCIIDWRDKDSLLEHPSYGAEDSYYKSLKYPYESKDAEYEVLEELLLVKGVNREIFDKVKDYLTVYSEGKVNINTASKEVLSALGLTNELISKILSFRYGADLEEATSDDNIFTSSSSIVAELKQFVTLDLSEAAQLEAFISKGKLTTIPQNFMIKSTAKLNNRDITYQIIAIVGPKGEVKYWQEG